MREPIETRRKALKINLDSKIYGTFAEIGGGQEVARNFFTAGAASGTIAKSMSAYDMVFSNAIYGVEKDGRYVSKSRLQKMLDHEFGLLTERLSGATYRDKAFFAFADTVATLNFNKTNEAHGWIGLRYQLNPNQEPNDIILHVLLKDSDSTLQQQVLGILGVNLLYGAYYEHANIQNLVESLGDNLSVDAVGIDVISLSGPAFERVNDRFANLYLVAKGFTGAAIFDDQGKVCQAKDKLYKKDIMILRTGFGQKSNPNFDLFNHAVAQFKRSQAVKDENLLVMIEILMTDIFSDDEHLTTENLEALAKRTEELCQTGNHIIVSNFSRNHKLAQYLCNYKPNQVGLSTNTRNLRRIFDPQNYGARYTDELLNYVHDLFSRNVRLYAYPYRDKENQNALITTKNMPVSATVKPLFDFLTINHYIVDIQDYDAGDVKVL